MNFPELNYTFWKHLHKYEEAYKYLNNSTIEKWRRLQSLVDSVENLPLHTHTLQMKIRSFC